MNRNKITVFLPCRKGSERIQEKNIRPFAGHDNGLIGIKLYQLLKVEQIDEIVVSSNDDVVLEIAKKLNENRIKIDYRDKSLCSSETSTDSLINYVPQVIDDGLVLWTHVTSPFFNATDYRKAIQNYLNVCDEFDSLMSVEKCQEFIWSKDGPINYDMSVEKWPRTQTLNSCHKINSAIFLTSIEIYRKQKNRIGNNPFKYEVDKITGWDIDWPEDFLIGEQLLELKHARI